MYDVPSMVLMYRKGRSTEYEVGILGRNNKFIEERDTHSTHHTFFYHFRKGDVKHLYKYVFRNVLQSTEYE